MTVHEIFGELAAHMIKGIMLHQQLANYYDFLGLKGYRQCHEYHYLDETCAYRRLCKFFIKHYNQLIPQYRIQQPNQIPSNWYKYTRDQIDISTKRSAVKEGLQAWLGWEKDTRSLYESMYKQLIDLNEIVAAMELKQMICDVEEEINKAESYHLQKKTLDYNIEDIYSEQKDKKQKYKLKKKEMFYQNNGRY